jgi:hypothetical protein
VNGIDELTKAIKKLNIDLVSLVAETAIWADPSFCDDPGTVVLYPDIRRGKSGEKKGTIINGIRIDDNTYANTAIKRACGINKKGIKNYETCHIWPDTCYDERFHTAIPNLVLIPNAIAGLSDFFDDVIKALQYHSYELYNWYSEGYQIPTRPKNYPTNWRKPTALPKSKSSGTRKGSKKNDGALWPVEKMIKTIGMATFVKYYEYFSSDNYSVGEIKQKMKTDEKYTENSRNTKASMGKRIFKENLEQEALKLIAQSDNVDNETKGDAKKYLGG